MNVGWNGLTPKSLCSSIAIAWIPVITVGSILTSKLPFTVRNGACTDGLHRELARAADPFIKQEDEGKFRCKTCQKLFKATSFVEKHIANKHPELVKHLDEVCV